MVKWEVNVLATERGAATRQSAEMPSASATTQATANSIDPLLIGFYWGLKIKVDFVCLKSKVSIYALGV